MSGRFSIEKGKRRERQLVNKFKDAGIPARRVSPLETTGDHKGDVEIYLGRVLGWEDRENVRTVEVKSGEDLRIKRVRRWLRGKNPEKANDFLVLDEDGREVIIVMSLETMIELL